MSKYLVCRDYQGRTCLQLEKQRDNIIFLPMPVSEGFEVHTTTTKSFFQRYKALPKYPIDKACQLFLGYCIILGASNEVLDYLSAKTIVTKEDYKIATSKYANRPK